MKNDLFTFIFLLFFIVLPALRWIFTKLYQLSQAQQQAIQRAREAARRRLEAQGEPDSEWVDLSLDETEIEMDEPVRPTPSPRAAPEIRTPTPRRRPVPRSPVGQLTEFLEEMTREARGRPEFVEAPPAPPRPVPPPPARKETTVATLSPAVAPPKLKIRPLTPGPSGRKALWLKVPDHPSDLQKMIVWSELLSPPLALRERLPGDPE